MYIQVNLPIPGMSVKSTKSVTEYDENGMPVKTDEAGTWYQITQSRVIAREAEKGFKTDIDVIVDLRRIDDEGDFCDESVIPYVWCEAHFTD